MGSFDSRFGAGGIYTDLRILVPMFVMAMILVLGWQYRSPVDRAASQIMAEELDKATNGLGVGAPKPPAPRHAESAARTESWSVSLADVPPEVYAGLVGGVIAVIGVVGAAVLLRRSADDGAEPEPHRD